MARTARCLRPPSARRRPSCATSRGPSSRNSIPTRAVGCGDRTTEEAAGPGTLQRRRSETAAVRLGIPRNVWAMGWTSLVNDAASELLYPVLPLFLVSTLGAPVAAVG